MGSTLVVAVEFSHFPPENYNGLQHFLASVDSFHLFRNVWLVSTNLTVAGFLDEVVKRTDYLDAIAVIEMGEAMSVQSVHKGDLLDWLARLGRSHE